MSFVSMTSSQNLSFCMSQKTPYLSLGRFEGIFEYFSVPHENDVDCVFVEAGGLFDWGIVQQQTTTRICYTPLDISQEDAGSAWARRKEKPSHGEMRGLFKAGHGQSPERINRSPQSPLQVASLGL